MTTPTITPAPGATRAAAPAPAAPARRAAPARDVEDTRAAERAQAERAQVEAALREANEVLVQKGAQLTFELDDQSQRVIVRLVDTTTKEVLRQIPSKEALAIARALSADDGAWRLIRARA